MSANYVKATTPTTLEIDSHYFPVRILTAGEAFAALFRKSIRFDNGRHVVDAPFVAMDKDHESYNGDAWLAARDVFLSDTRGYPALRSGKGGWPIPTVIRVRDFVRERKGVVRRHKPSFKELLVKHNYTCGISGVRYGPEEYTPSQIREIFNMDHIVPRKHGGPDEDYNLILATREENSKKADQFPYRRADGTELRAILNVDFFPELQLHGVRFQEEWAPLLFKS